MRQVIQKVLEALFRVLFTYECVGEEKVPASGPAVVVSNHPSYLDPVLLSLQVKRPIHFMAWDALFRVPLLGSLIQLLGAIPVDTRKGKGREAYERARSFVEEGEIVGIFPEGRRSTTGWMEPSFRAGAARLAWETGAPLLPATITGAFRAWPHYQSLPHPARVKVRFHDAIDPGPYRHLSEEEAVPLLLAELRRRVDRTLLPGVKADLRINLIYRLPSPWPRAHESFPALALALLVFWRTREWLSVAPAYGYLLYLFLDHFAIPQRRIVKRLRNVSPVLFLLGFGPVVLGALALPDVPAERAVFAIALGALVPYLYERGRTALDFIRGLVFACGLELGAQLAWPAAVGPHTALPLFAAAYAWAGRTVFWRYSAPVLAAYAFAVPWLLGGRLQILPHATAGLLAWLLVRIFPYRPSPAAEEPEPVGLGLRL